MFCTLLDKGCKRNIDKLKFAQGNRIKMMAAEMAGC